MIVIINGALGVGKTEVSWKLIEHFDQAIMLDGDYLGAVQPFEIYDDARVEYLYQTIRHIVAWHVEHGYHNFVVNYVFETPESLSQLRQMLSACDDVTYAFRLTCSEAEMERRLQSRSSDADRLRWELNRFRELAAIQDENARRGDLGDVIDTTALTIDQAAEAIWHIIREKVEIVPYNPEWPAQFEAEKRRIEGALGALAIEIHHMGSTAIPGLAAKPIIDIMIVVRKLDDAAQCIAPLKELGYTFVDHPENVDRRFFRRGQRPRTHHIHIVEQDSQALKEHLVFRDALRGDPQLRDRYAALKYDLAERCRNDRAQYTKSKTEFVTQVIKSMH
jgi:GrpB-like predicted nucleotidyltransferase (UPF0157 family)/predicted kinase